MSNETRAGSIHAELGLLLAVGALSLMMAPAPALSASFRCDGSLSLVETMVCQDPALSAQDETIASLYGDLRRQDPSDELRATQRRWLAERDRCESLPCLSEVYATRLSQLSEITSAQLSFSGAPPDPDETSREISGTATETPAPAAPITRALPDRTVRAPKTTSPAGLTPLASSSNTTVPTGSDTTVWGTLIAILAVLLGFSALVKRGRQSRRRDAFALVDAIIAEHRKPLALRRRQLIVTDPYGTLLLKPWRKEALYFYETKIKPRLTLRQQQIVGAHDPYALIESHLEAQGIDLKDLDPSFKGNDAVQYEHHCAEILRQAGWDARVTKGSGDQGSDVIAERGDAKIVLQCKLYSHPVGNKAVQEIAAARAHELAQYAACVTNSNYTPSAKALAVTNTVALLHHDQLRDWVEELAEVPSHMRH